MYILYALVMYFDMYILGLVFLVWLKLYLKSYVMVLMVKKINLCISYDSSLSFET